jgi:NADH-quinone oxidoreductase subunit A
MIEYVGLIWLSLLTAVTVGTMMCLPSVLGPKRPNPVKDQPFECGVEPLGTPQGQFSVKFYIAAMLFIVFDVELVFLFPWAVLLRELAWPGIISMGVFLLFIVGGFVYVWRKGALEWE